MSLIRLVAFDLNIRIETIILNIKIKILKKYIDSLFKNKKFMKKTPKLENNAITININKQYKVCIINSLFKRGK
jgi:hypothetical protein